MSAFGSTVGVICADYFGDELGIPLPSIGAINKSKTEAKAVNAGDSTTNYGRLQSIKGSGKRSVWEFVREPQKAAPALVPAFDGLHPYETLAFN